MAPRSRPAPERPPVENCTMRPGQCVRSPSSSLAKRPTSEVGVPSSLRTWAWTMVAPASNASCADSICSGTVIGTAGLSDFLGSDPVMAQQIMQGILVMTCSNGPGTRLMPKPFQNLKKWQA